MLPTIGRIVHYTLTDADASLIQQRREKEGTIANPAEAGHVYPAKVVRTFGGEAANLQVYLDGPDAYWATSRAEGDQPGQWVWPPRV